MDTQTIEVASLGRPFSLGTLYDSQNDSLNTGLSLWGRDHLLKHIGERPQYYSNFEIIASESAEDKSSALNVNASLKLSILLGLINIEGSAKYLTDYRKSKNQARVTLKYEVTTKFKELSMDHLGANNVTYRDILKKETATHVVTGILYGARAFLVFDCDVSEEENYEEIQCNLKCLVLKIPCFNATCDGLMTLDEQDKAADMKLSCKFIGDFSLNTNPKTYQEAVEVYRTLPKLLGENKENVVPLKVWMLPLTYFDSSAAKPVCHISTELIHIVQHVLEDYSDLEMRCNDALNTSIAQMFPEICKNLHIFQKWCCDFKEKFQKAIVTKLPSIRSGDAAAPEEIFASFSKNQLMLKQWMDWEEKEIYFLKLFMKMKNTKIVLSQKEIDVEILSADHTVCLVFTSPLSKYLEQILKAHDPQHPLDHDAERFSSALDAIRHKAKLFSDFAEANEDNNNIRFLTVGLTGETKGTRIYLYRDGHVINEDFEPPSKPETVTEIGATHDSVTLNVRPAQFGIRNINYYSAEYCVCGENKWEPMRASPGEVTVSGLTPNTEYMFRCRAVTSVGVGPAREFSGSIKTLSLVQPIIPQPQPQTVYYVNTETVHVQTPNSKKTATVDVCTTTCDLPQASLRVLEDILKMEIRCNDALKTTIAQQFSEISKNLQTFKNLCFGLKLESEQTFAKTDFPAFINNLNKWMDCQEEDINALMSITKMMQNTKVVPSENDLYEEIKSPKNVVCFVLTSVGSTDSYLSYLSNYLSEKNKQDLQPPPNSVEDGQGFFSQEVLDATRHKAKLFSDFAEANKDNNNIRFLIVGLAGETKGTMIHLYKDGHLINEDFEPPSKPETVTESDVTHDSVTLNVRPAQFGAENITCYSAEYCVCGENKWEPMRASPGEVTVSGLTPSMEYVFRCRAVTSVGVGPAREFSGSIKTLPSSPPGRLHVKPAAREIEVTWERPAEVGHTVHILNYIIEFTQTDRRATKKDLQWNHMVTTAEIGIISGLQPETEYTLRVRCECGGAGRSKESVPVNVRTTSSLPELLKSTSRCIKFDYPSVYKLPLTKDLNTAGSRRCSYGTETEKQNRTIILLGATGAGKSTLIDMMINYIVGVEWSDDYRFKLTNVSLSGPQARNQTSEVTVYKIHHQEGFKIPFSLTVVDTPGFVRTRGAETDVRQQLCRLFTSVSGVSQIDAVCVVAAVTHVTLTQKHLFDSMLSIFGKDVAENIRVLLTFTDGKCSAALETVRAVGVPSPHAETNKPTVHFKFNSSALSECRSAGEGTEVDESLNEMFWSLSMKSLKKFFVDLNETNTNSLALTREVLRRREELEASVENLKELFELLLAKQEEIQEMTEILEDCETEITRTQKVEFEFTVRKRDVSVTSSTGHAVTCLKCRCTCHYPRKIQNHKGKQDCAAAEDDRCCAQCPGKCQWTEHVSQDIREKLRVTGLKEKHALSAAQTKMVIQALVEKLLSECESVQGDMMILMDTSDKCLHRLKKISLKPNPVSTPDYIHMLIEGEKSEARPRWRDRVHSLIRLKEETERMAEVRRDKVQSPPKAETETEPFSA